MSKKWYEYLLTVRTTETDVMDADIEDTEEEESTAPAQFVAVPAALPAKGLLPTVGSPVAEAISRPTVVVPPPMPSSLPIMTPATKNSMSTNTIEPAVQQSSVASTSQPELKLLPVAIIYDDANISEMTHGYSALKVVNMLKSEHLRNMPMDAKRSSILLALEASGTRLQDVVDDGLRRIRLLQQQERDTARSLEALERRKVEENQNIAEELARIVQEYNQRMQSNSEHVARMKAQFLSWRMEVKEEEQKISEALSYFTGQSLAVKEKTETGKGEKP